MSNRFGLTTGNLAPGVSYACAYGRMRIGWDFARAISEPPVKRAPRKSPQQRLDEYAARRAVIAAKHAKRKAEGEALLFAWDRADWNRKARVDRVRAPVLDEVPRPKWMAPIARPERPKPKRKRHINSAEDTSPDHIRQLRAALCAEFIKTGNLNDDITKQLKDYADACKQSAQHARRVSAEPAAQDSGQRRVSLRDDRGRDDGQSHDAPAG